MNLDIWDEMTRSKRNDNEHNFLLRYSNLFCENHLKVLIVVLAWKLQRKKFIKLSFQVIQLLFSQTIQKNPFIIQKIILFVLCMCAWFLMDTALKHCKNEIFINTFDLTASFTFFSLWRSQSSLQMDYKYTQMLQPMKYLD